jgi:hypothetical protein
VIDRPFTESKELIAGSGIIPAKSTQEAIEGRGASGGSRATGRASFARSGSRKGFREALVVARLGRARRRSRRVELAAPVRRVRVLQSSRDPARDRRLPEHIRGCRIQRAAFRPEPQPMGPCPGPLDHRHRCSRALVVGRGVTGLADHEKGDATARGRLAIPVVVAARASVLP